MDRQSRLVVPAGQGRIAGPFANCERPAARWPIRCRRTTGGDAADEDRHKSLLVITNWRDTKHPDAGGAEVVCERLARIVRRDGGRKSYCWRRQWRGRVARRGDDGFWIIRRGGRFTVYPWALFWLLLHRKQIIGVVDSQNGIPFFTPLAVGSKTPVLLLLHHVHQDQFSLYFSPLMAHRRPLAGTEGVPSRLPRSVHRGRLAVHPRSAPAVDWV